MPRSHRLALNAVIATAVILLIAACGGPKPPSWTDTNAYIEITSDAGFVFTQAGDTATIAAVVRKRSDGSVIEDADVVFTSSAAGVVSVNASTGELTAQSSTPGSAVISATYGELTPAIAGAAVAVLSPETVFVPYDDFVDFDRDTGELILERGALGEGLIPGDVLLSGDRAGLLDRVVSVDVQVDRVVVMTEPADLTDAFDELDIDVEGAPTTYQAVFNASGLSVYDHLGDLVTTSAFGFECKGEMEQPIAVTFTGSSITQTIEFTPSARLKITRTGYVSATVDLFELAATGVVRFTAQSGSIEFAAGVSGKITCERKLSNVPLAFVPIVGPLGAAPTVTPSFGFELKGEASLGSIKVTGPSIDEGVQARMGLLYTGAGGGSFSAFSTNSRIGSGLSWGSYKDDLKAEFKATVEPFLKGTLNVSANLAKWSLADFGFAEAKVYGGAELQMQTPFDYTEVGYVGPQWKFYVGVYGGLDPLFEKINEFQKFINRVGIKVAVTGFDAELFKGELPLLSQPKPLVTVSPLKVNIDDEVMFGVSQAGVGRTEFVGYKLDDDDKPTAGVTLTDTTTGAAGVSYGFWTPGEDDGGKYHVRAMSFHGAFGTAGFPYASADHAAFEVTDAVSLRIDPAQLLDGVVDEEYEFELVASGIPEAITSVTFEWSFGQGAPGLATVSVVDGGASTTIANTYTTPGSYTITATLKDGAEELATATAPVEIEGVVVTIDPASLQGEIDTAYGFTFRAAGLPSTLTSVTFEWNFGSGTGATGSEIVAVSDGQASLAKTHTYTAVGAFGVFVSVKDGATVLGGATGVATIGEVTEREEDLTVCDVWKAANSGGVGVTVDVWDISTIPTGAVFDIRFDTVGMPDKYIVEYPVGNLVLDTGWRGDSWYDGQPAYPGGVVGGPSGQVDGMFTKTTIDGFKVTTLGGEPGTVWYYDIRCRLP